MTGEQKVNDSEDSRGYRKADQGVLILTVGLLFTHWVRGKHGE